MSKSHWGLAAMKLVLSWLKAEFKQLFTLWVVKFVDRHIASFIKSSINFNSAHPLSYKMWVWGPWTSWDCFKFKYITHGFVELGAERWIIKWVAWGAFLWESRVWFSDPVLNSFCWSKNKRGGGKNARKFAVLQSILSTNCVERWDLFSVLFS